MQHSASSFMDDAGDCQFEVRLDRDNGHRVAHASGTFLDIRRELQNSRYGKQRLETKTRIPGMTGFPDKLFLVGTGRFRD